MSTNCVRCVINERTGLDLLCDQCRAIPAGMARCISLHQPWASLMACGAKWMETRSWNTRVRGEVFIHASKSRAGIDWVDHAAEQRVVDAMAKALGMSWAEFEHRLPFGQVIALGFLGATLPTAEALRIEPKQEPFGDFTPGRFAHVYGELQAIEPISLPAKQGWFFIPRP
jgi:hypothetical protein